MLGRSPPSVNAELSSTKPAVGAPVMSRGTLTAGPAAAVGAAGEGEAAATTGEAAALGLADGLFPGCAPGLPGAGEPSATADAAGGPPGPPAEGVPQPRISTRPAAASVQRAREKERIEKPFCRLGPPRVTECSGRNGRPGRARLRPRSVRKTEQA